jgi:hypothetical protein
MKQIDVHNTAKFVQLDDGMANPAEAVNLTRDFAVIPKYRLLL